MFNEKSGLVKIWVGLVLNPENNYTIDDVPNISNLKEVVAAIVNGETK